MVRGIIHSGCCFLHREPTLDHYPFVVCFSQYTSYLVLSAPQLGDNIIYSTDVKV